MATETEAFRDLVGLGLGFFRSWSRASLARFFRGDFPAVCELKLLIQAKVFWGIFLVLLFLLQPAGNYGEVAFSLSISCLLTFSSLWCVANEGHLLAAVALGGYAPEFFPGAQFSFRCSGAPRRAPSSITDNYLDAYQNFKKLFLKAI